MLHLVFLKRNLDCDSHDGPFLTTMSMGHSELKFCPSVGKGTFYFLPSTQTGFKVHLASYQMWTEGYLQAKKQPGHEI